MKENYLENIRGYILDEQARTIVRDYTANQTKLETYYKIGKELSEAIKYYSENVIKMYAKNLTEAFGKKYQYKELCKMIKFHNLCKKLGKLDLRLTWKHYKQLLSMEDIKEVKYYINITINEQLNYKDLKERIKTNEYTSKETNTNEKE